MSELKDLQKEAERIQYSLRSTFFYRRHRELQRLAKEVGQLDTSAYDWKSPEALGITKASWKRIANKGISPLHIFCHPEVIRQNPSLIAYYRLIAILPQKGIQRLAFGINNLEQGTGRTLSLDRARVLAKVLNTFISALIDTDPDFSYEDALLAGQMNLGTQINGSWRNEIGAEGTRRVKELILHHFQDQGLITYVTAKDGTLIPFKHSLPAVQDIQGFVAMNGYRIIFGSEPDVSILNPTGLLEVAIEVKAGIDPAGALERYGAAKKSFDKALRQNKSAVTIYLANLITEGVRQVMADDRLVREDFNLTNVLVDEEAKEKFLEHIRWLMHL